MSFRFIKTARVLALTLALTSLAIFQSQAQSNLLVRIMAANTTSGNGQSYEVPGIRIFQGLKPDIVAAQEFRYNSSSSTANLRALVDTAFGTNFEYYVEPSGNIPNGIISRWHISAAGSWDSPYVSDRGFAWAQIDLPNTTNKLYVVSVHLYGSGTATQRGDEANIIKSNILAHFPAGAWVVVAGDMNTGSRTEAAINNFTTFLSDSPVPTDSPYCTNSACGDDDTNEPRNKPYDYVLPSFSLTAFRTSSVLPSISYSNGLVLDSSVFANYAPLSAISPVQSGDSHVTGMQHMAVIKDFLLPGSSASATNIAPSITTQPQPLTVPLNSNATFTVIANGTAPLTYQWRFYGTNLTGATTTSYTRTNAQTADAGPYTVVVTNIAGSVTSSIAQLTINSAPFITSQPQNLIVNVGDDAPFFVFVNGAAPLSYQWRFAGTNIANATDTSYTRTNAQLADAGSYTVVITNASGSATSSPAALTVLAPQTVSIIAQWNFNSVPPDGMVTTGTNTPSIGSGTASLIGGTTATFATGDTALDPAGSTDNTGWNTATYPAVSANNKTAGTRFNVSTVGKQNIFVTWTSQASNTGSKYARLQYSSNGTDFVDFDFAFTNVAGSFTRKTNSLANVPTLNNNPNFAVRFVSEFESSATQSGAASYIAANPANMYGTSGTIRYDMVTIWGSTLVTNSLPPAQAASLTNATFNAGQFSFLLNGTTGSNYIVQASADLSASNWTSLRTNAAPFTFTETNAAIFPQRFYRAILAP